MSISRPQGPLIIRKASKNNISSAEDTREEVYRAVIHFKRSNMPNYARIITSFFIMLLNDCRNIWPHTLTYIQHFKHIVTVIHIYIYTYILKFDYNLFILHICALILFNSRICCFYCKHMFLHKLIICGRFSSSFIYFYSSRHLIKIINYKITTKINERMTSRDLDLHYLLLKYTLRHIHSILGNVFNTTSRTVCGITIVDEYKDLQIPPPLRPRSEKLFICSFTLTLPSNLKFPNLYSYWTLNIKKKISCWKLSPFITTFIWNFIRHSGSIDRNFTIIKYKTIYVLMIRVKHTPDLGYA